MAQEGERQDKCEKKGKKCITFKANTYDADDTTLDEDEDDEEMALLPQKFKNLNEEKGETSRATNNQEFDDRQFSKSKEDNKGKDVICFQCWKRGHIKPDCSSLKKLKKKFEKKRRPRQKYGVLLNVNPMMMRLRNKQISV